MEIVMNSRGLVLPLMAQGLIKRKCYKLEQTLGRFNLSCLSLFCAIKFIHKTEMYQVDLRLQLPDCELPASAQGASITGVFGSSFRKLFKSVSEFKAKLGSAESYNKKKEKAVHSLAEIPMSLVSRTMLSEFFTKNYSRFYNYALREIRFRSYQGYTKPGLIDVSDMLDEALLAVADQFSLDFKKENAMRLFFREIKRAIEQNMNPGGVALISCEQPIEPEDIDASYGEYYHPDEVITVEDILIDPDSMDPEQVVEYRDVESHIDKLLAQLPADWREAFILSLREELPVEDIARNRGKSTERIEEDIESAKAFIREKLRDAGFMWRR